MGNLIDIVGQSTASTPEQYPSYGPWVQQCVKWASGQHPFGHSNSSGPHVGVDSLVTIPAEETAAKKAITNNSTFMMNNDYDICLVYYI